MVKRAYGRTGEMLTIIGFGGIIVMGEEQSSADAFVSEAVDFGINYFDVAPGYGNAQEKLGPALEPYRGKVFLACKTTDRTKDGSRKELEDSLKKLRTDHFDLYQFHAVTTLDDVDRIFCPSGAMETFIRAREEGKARYLGFSAHSEEAAQAMFDRYDFDSVLFPVNWASLLSSGFGAGVMRRAAENGAATLALKALARTHWPEDLPVNERPYPKCWYQPLDDEYEASLALRFTLSQQVVSALTPGDIRLFRIAIKAAAGFRPVTEDEIAVLMSKYAGMKPVFPF